MKFAIHDSHEPLTREMISQFERDLGIVLPDDYRQFLLEHNGGYFADSVAYALLEPPDWMGDDLGGIDDFLGINADEDVSDIKSTVDCYRGRMPANILPIASAPGGDMICMSVADDDFGHIYLWDWEEEPRQGESPSYRNLHLIAESFTGFLIRLELDMEEGANQPQEKNELFRAAEMGNVATFQRLIAQGVDIEKTNESGRTLLMVASANRRPEILRILLVRGARVDRKDSEGRDAIYHAAHASCCDCVKLLLAHGADPNTSDAKGITALMKAIEQCARRVAKVLITHGADVNARSANGQTPLSSTEVNLSWDKAFRQYLIHAGARE